MARIALIALLAVLIQASKADASVQRPPSPVGITVRYEPCPGYPNVAGCTIPGEPVVYVNAGPNGSARWSRLHELGHKFAEQVRMTGAIQRFGSLTHRHGLQIEDERFADAYASCALGYEAGPGSLQAGRFPTGYGYWPSQRTQRVVCAMLARAGHQVGLQ